MITNEVITQIKWHMQRSKKLNIERHGKGICIEVGNAYCQCFKMSSVAEAKSEVERLNKVLNEVV